MYLGDLGVRSVLSKDNKCVQHGCLGDAQPSCFAAITSYSCFYTTTDKVFPKKEMVPWQMNTAVSVTKAHCKITLADCFILTHTYMSRNWETITMHGLTRKWLRQNDEVVILAQT